ncbi:MAG TPA: pyridoxal phosphate-dependent aminotransferase [Albitalea sp.]|uniref:pyridoxal phosphate-dependent aminotransferase n=1 Tax=Piscinibacter sp. TaxID=1903157 RepID=UPI002ED45DF3
MNRFPPNDIIQLVGHAPRFDLAESVGPDLRLAEVLDAGGIATLSQLALGYGSAAGDAPLRRVIGEMHSVDADDVVITAGGMHALFLLAFALCDRGSQAVVASPLFPLARNALTAVGVEARTLPLSFDQRYQPDLSTLRRLLTPDTRLVSLASPQNPSGVALSPDTLREVHALMQAHAPQAWLLVDETYREAAYGADPIQPSAATLGPRVVCTGSLSKCHGAPGLRIGWAITRDAVLREQLVTAKFNTVISCGRLDEAVALSVLQQRERVVGTRRKLLADNLAITEAWVKRESDRVEWVRPDAGALCCVRLRSECFDDAAVQRLNDALGRHSVRVGDGRWFAESPRVFRLGFGLLDRDGLAQALEAVSAALREIT